MTIKRNFVDLEDAQVHFRSCGDPGLPPLVMFHGSPGSSYSLMPLAVHLARGRRVIALDTLGNGDSSPAPMAQPEIGDYVEAHLRAIQALGLNQVDLYGFHTGATIAIELSLRHPDRVKRMVLEGVSLFDAEARDELFKHDHAPAIPVDLEGTHLIKVWTMVRDAHLFWPWWARGKDNRRQLGLPSADYLHGEVLEVLKAISTYHLSYRAALRYPKRERLPRITVPALVAANPSDQLYPFTDAVAALIPGAESLELAVPRGEAELAQTAGRMLEFLDR